ncbi:MAG: cysteine--tRNA ligase [Patescibacteria group bacterium]
MSIKLHNTLSGTLEEFRPIKPGEALMYHCGPTVYNYAHIGNLRSYVFADILRRTLEYLGFEVTQVINITDIGHLTSDADTGDDKMLKGLKREGLAISLEGLKELGDKYEDAFKKDLEALNIETPHHFPRATKYLKQDIELVQKLEQLGFAYKLADGVYFDTGKLKDYGKLGGLTPTSEALARVGSDEKKNPRDFVLWKLSKDDHLGFESPWGVGFPGWHLECSVMSKAILGQPFDIHTGGIDHIPVHHNNEIAQSESAYNSALSNFWLHNEFLTLADGKMAKSEGNEIILNTLVEKGFFPLAYRYFLLMAHYRTPVNFSDTALSAAQNAYRKLKDVLTLLPKDGKISPKYKKDFQSALEDDLNTPEALSLVWGLIKDDSISPADKRATLLDFDQVLGLNLLKNEFLDIPKTILELGEKRKLAKEKGNFQESDKIREEIESQGFEIRDTGETFVIFKR